MVRYCPAGQGAVHAPPATLSIVPGHVVHTEDPAVLDVPAAHTVHVVPVPLYPALH